MPLKYAHLDKPEVLKDCTERNYPLIYPGDMVFVGSSWADEESENPHKGKKGKVNGVGHGLQSRFNRDYLNVSIVDRTFGIGYFSTWLYTLDLVDSNRRTLELIQTGKLVYPNDRIQVTNPEHGQHEHIGMVAGVSEMEGELVYNVEDDDCVDQLYIFQRRVDREIEDETLRMLADKKTRANFVDRLKEKGIYDAFVAEGSLEEAYQTSVRRQATVTVESTQPYVKDRAIIVGELNFRVKASDAVLIEKFPPNKMWRF